jgi:poly(glycerol-phosphate) alpha-glucosyltransferase
VGKEECYRACDAVVLPSLSEGLPMGVLEAWAHGKPVLMTPQCNLPEGFAAGAALRVEGSVAGMEAGLRTLWGMSRNELAGMGERGRDLVARRFAWGNIAREMKGVYEWILGGGPRPGCVEG